MPPNSRITLSNCKVYIFQASLLSINGWTSERVQKIICSRNKSQICYKVESMLKIKLDFWFFLRVEEPVHQLD
jgi:hypothetical protein